MQDGQSEEPPSFRSQFKAEINTAASEEQEFAQEGPTGGGISPIERYVWHIYESGVRDYEVSFDEILPRFGIASFNAWMHQRKGQGLTTHILDLMGGNGTFLRSLSKVGRNEVDPAFDLSLSVGLADERQGSDYAKDEDKRRKVDLLVGDITSGKTWHEIREWLGGSNIPKFDMVICRGVSGIDLIPVALYPALFRRIYEYTTNQNGLIMTQLSPESDKDLMRWTEQLNQNPGIRAIGQKERHDWHYSSGAGYPAIGILKTQKAPTSLRI